MTMILRTYSHLATTESGLVTSDPLGSLSLSYADVEVAGPADLGNVFVVPAATGSTRSTWGRKTLYDWNVDGEPDWELLEFFANGFLRVYYLLDVPTSSTDLTPTNGATTRHWQNRAMSNKRGLSFDSPLGDSNPTDADNITDTGAGYPTIVTDAGTVEARVYKVVAYNPSEDDDVIVNRNLVY